MICTTLKRLKAHQKYPCIELRLDYLDDIDLEEVAAFRRSIEGEVIFTLRKSSQGGQFKGTEEERLSLIDKLCRIKPDFFDIESEVPLEIIKVLQKNHPTVQWIVSFHDFDHMPTDFTSLLSTLEKVPANYYKIAGLAKSTLDTLRLLAWLKNAKRSDLIMISMGEFGVPGRILARYFGSALTYVSEEGESTAAGQLTFEEMKLYAYFTHPAFYGLIGDPVEHSVGHIYHNARMKEEHLNALYVKLNISKDALKECFPLITELGFKGLSVTMPLKEEIVVYADRLTPDAEKIKAVNTLARNGDKWLGSNTDGDGALVAMEKNLGEMKNKKVILLGAGGAARAILYSLTLAGAWVTLVNRDEQRGLSLAATWGIPFCPLAKLISLNSIDYDLFINTTPFDCQLDVKWMNPDMAIMDIKSFPRETLLLKEASKKGCKVIYGSEMFIEQAELQLKTWFKV